MLEEKSDEGTKSPMPKAEDCCEFLNADTLVLEHYGPRVLGLGPLTRLNAVRGPMSIQKRIPGLRSMAKERRPSPFQIANRSVDLSMLKSLSGSHPHSRPSRNSTPGLYDLRDHELRVYEDFVKLLKALPRDSAVELLRAAQRDSELI